jgi:hypothetical protein
MHNSAVGIDTGYVENSPLSCLQLPELLLYQAFADGHTAAHRLTALVPEPLRALQRRHAAPTHAPTAEV